MSFLASLPANLAKLSFVGLVVRVTAYDEALALEESKLGVYCQVDGVLLRTAIYRDYILPSDKNLLNDACKTIKNKLEEKLKLYGLMI